MTRTIRVASIRGFLLSLCLFSLGGGYLLQERSGAELGKETKSEAERETTKQSEREKRSERETEQKEFSHRAELKRRAGGPDSFLPDPLLRASLPRKPSSPQNSSPRKAQEVQPSPQLRLHQAKASPPIRIASNAATPQAQPPATSKGEDEKKDPGSALVPAPPVNSSLRVIKQHWVEAPEAPVPPKAVGQPDFPALARYARSAVVSIVATPRKTYNEHEDPSAREFFERFYGGDEPHGRGMASGFVIHPDGFILTNGHVVEDAATVAVTLGDDEARSYPAAIIGRDDLSDLALLKIEADHPLDALALGDSDTLQVGDWVTAIGNPFGLSQTLTVGVVSFLGRRDVNPSGRPGYYDFIQTDASINPGNSGGPLIDAEGRVVGISAAVNANGQGIAFAIPVNMAKDVLAALYDRGFVERSFLGVSIQDLTPELAESFGLESSDGVVVTEVSSHGPAQGAGILVGDVILNFNGEPIARAHRLRWLASGAGVGRRAKVGLIRQGKPRQLQVKLAPLPGIAGPKFERSKAPKPVAELAPLGFSVDGNAKASMPGLRVLRVDPNSHAYIAGLREGDVLLEMDGKSMAAPRDVEQTLGDRKNGAVRLLIRRGNRPMFLGFRL